MKITLLDIHNALMNEYNINSEEALSMMLSNTIYFSQILLMSNLVYGYIENGTM